MDSQDVYQIGQSQLPHCYSTTNTFLSLAYPQRLVDRLSSIQDRVVLLRAGCVFATRVQGLDRYKQQERVPPAFDARRPPDPCRHQKYSLKVDQICAGRDRWRNVPLCRGLEPTAVFVGEERDF